MTTKNRNFQKTNFRPGPLKVVERELPPRVSQEKNGSLVLLCPFCVIPHVIQVNQESACGALLRVTVVQPVFKSKHFKGMKCAKCGQDGGEMVKLNKGFIHANDCMPGMVPLNDKPPFSKMAEIIYKMKDGKVKSYLKKKLGNPQPVHEITPEGDKTGVTLGYVFYWSEKNE